MSLFHREFHQQAAVNSTLAAAPPSVRGVLQDIIAAALQMNIPWLKIFMAFATAAAGGFSPAAIAAAITMLFGINIPTSLAPHANQTSTVAPTS